MSKVDILIPAYNAAHFLRDTLESVLAQTEPDWRILLVDDGSTDGTRALVEDFVREHGDRLRGRLTYLYQQNRGLPAARNTGIRAGTSPVIALLDADDLWVPTRLQDSLESLEGKPEAGLSYGGVSRFYEPGTVLDTYTSSDPGSSRIETATKLYTRAVNFPCPTVSFRRECVERVGMFDETMRATEDRDLWLRIAQHYRVVFVPRVLGLYRLSAVSMSANLDRMLQSQMQFIHKHAGEFGCGWAQRQVALASVYRDQAVAYRERGERGTAARFAVATLAHAPWVLRNWRIVLRALI